MTDQRTEQPHDTLMSLARDIGLVRDVAARRSDPDRDHLQMLARLDKWRETVLSLLEPPAVPAPAPWRDISSAPTDGTTVLLWWHDRDVDWWACARWMEFNDGSRGWIGESFHASVEKSWTRLLGESPTHWMPLPDPPVCGKPLEVQR